MLINVVKNTDNKEIPKYAKGFSAIADSILNSTDKVTSYECSVVFVEDREMLLINQAYRDIDASTDVISFALKDKDDNYDTTAEIDNYLGDIIINVAAVINQANEYQHSKKRETIFLFVHGLLHLLGYNHETKAEEETMFAIQRKIMNEIN